MFIMASSLTISVSRPPHTWVTKEYLFLMVLSEAEILQKSLLSIKDNNDECCECYGTKKSTSNSV